MERLTEKHYGANDYYMTCSAECERDQCVECAELEKIANLLGAYEDTGLTPSEMRLMRMDMSIIRALFQGAEVERLKALAIADEEGRVAVLPCKVGDMVWVPASDRLPAQDGQYLCLYSFPSSGHARSVLRPSVLDYYATDARPHFQYEGFRGMYVSYWMPLPPVPEVDDG